MSAWQTKPMDRFVLRWMKVHLSSRVTTWIIVIPWLRPWMITVVASLLGVAGGCAFALGLGWLAGVLALASQVLDGVDGQYARLTGRQGPAGAFLDSLMDRYTDGALVIGLTVYVISLPTSIPISAWVALSFLALVGTGLVSYSTARAEVLGLSMGRPTLASKGTRTAMIGLSGLVSPIWAEAPAAALVYLVLHTNGVVLWRIFLAHRQCKEGMADESPGNDPRQISGTP